MNIEQYREVATPIIEAAYAEGHNDDDLKMNLMVAGVPYSAINTVVKNIAIEKGLMVDPKTVTEDINEKVQKIEWADIVEWDQLEEVAGQVADNTEGATAARVVALARAYCKAELEIDLPKKPRTGFGGARVGKIAQAVVNLFADNKEPTKQEFYDAMVPAVGGDQQHANIIYYMGLHMAVCTAIATGGNLEDVAKAQATQRNPAPGEGVNTQARGSKGANATDAEVEEEGEEEEEEV